MGSLRFGILTVSDSCFRGEAVDGSGEELKKFIETLKQVGTVCKRKCVPDEIPQIQTTLLEWTDVEDLDVILTTGGTGFSPRDVTPEATKPLLEKEAPGFLIAIITKSLEITKMAMLSRPVCGIRKKTLILNLPGSSKGSVESLEIIIDQLKHAVDLIRDNLHGVIHQHHQMRKKNIKSAIDPCNVAARDRKSQFPLIEVAKAQEIILQHCTSIKEEKISLRLALGHILAEDVYARDPLPPFRASVKDGYAVKVHDGMQLHLLTVIGDSTAGDDPQGLILTKDNCVRVSTGAPVPEGSNSVVQVENTELVEKSDDGREEKTIRLLVQPIVGQDIRRVGVDIAQNELVLRTGIRLGPAEVGVLASVGAYNVSVYNKPLIALLSTGNELQDPMQEILLPGKIRDSNKTTLQAIFREEGYETIDVGIARDSPDEVYQKLLEALDVADIVVTTGGVSMGERDFMKQVLTTDIGATIHFGSVLMKPGKPTKFATCTHNGRKKFIFGLPGNPVSATVTSILFVIPACRKLSGWANPIHTRIKAAVAEALPLDITRPEYHRGCVIWIEESSMPCAYSTGNQASSRLTSCTTANALVCLPQGSDLLSEISKGTFVDCIMLSHY